jgi:hypothetical protein
MYVCLAAQVFNLPEAARPLIPSQRPFFMRCIVGDQVAKMTT